MHGVAAMAKREHIPVMLNEAMAGLAVRAGGRYLDGTFGRGGHAEVLLARLGQQGRLLLMDRDPQAIVVAHQRFAADPRVVIRHGNFADLGEWDAAAEGLDGVLLDLGISSPQLDEGGRGFSFQTDAPLDMRMDPSCGESAADFLARASEKEIAEVLWRYGEERMSRRIARVIVGSREQGRPFTGTRELADAVAQVVRYRIPGRHPATRTFQALRIQVNGELESIQRGLLAACQCLKPGSRLVVISFHSLEDRIVKQFMRGPQAPRVSRGLPAPEVPESPLRVMGKQRLDLIAVVLLLPAMMSSAIAVVWARNENRELFIQLTRLQNHRDQLNIEFGRLELEQATWADPAHIEAIARSQLGMISPDPAQVRVVRQ